MKNLISYEGYSFTLYAHKNMVNNKVYFGITKNRPEYRWKNGTGYSGTKFGRAVDKYGWASFLHIIIARNLNYTTALWLEEKFISYYDSTEDSKGYNTDKGGKKGLIEARERRLSRENNKKSFICLETKQIFHSFNELEVESNKDESYVKDSCESNGSRTHRGRHYLYLDYYKTLSKLDIKNIIKGKLENHKEVVCLETGEIFWNATEAEKTIPYGQACVSKRCRSFKKTRRNNKTGGMHWAFLEDYVKLSSSEVENNIFHDSSEVIRLDTLERYKDIKSASISSGIEERSIGRCCSGEFKHAGGINWLFLKDYRDRILKNLKTPKKVVCLETRKVYNSYKEAGEQCGESSESIRKACYKKEHNLKRLHWVLEVDFMFLSEERIKCIISNRRGKNDMVGSVPVVCLETKEVFPSSHEAQVRYNKTSVHCINSCCKRNDPNRITAGGKHWMYKEDYDNASNEDIELLLSTKKGQRISKAVVRLETKEVFSSITEASKATGISNKTIRYSCRGTRNTLSNKGHWMFKEEYDKLSPEEIDARLTKQKKK